MSYSKAEQETTLVFDYENNMWSVCSYCPVHITKLKKLTAKLGVELIVLEEKNSRVIGVKCTLPKNVIQFRTPVKKKDLTEDQREQLRSRLKANIHSKVNTNGK